MREPAFFGKYGAKGTTGARKCSIAPQSPMSRNDQDAPPPGHQVPGEQCGIDWFIGRNGCHTKRAQETCAADINECWGENSKRPTWLVITMMIAIARMPSRPGMRDAEFKVTTGMLSATTSKP